jgi:hypothetical protein
LALAEELENSTGLNVDIWTEAEVAELNGPIAGFGGK